jgi:cell division protein FtsX
VLFRSDIITAVERASAITMIVLIAAAILITFNTIRLAIYTAREELTIDLLQKKTKQLFKQLIDELSKDFKNN